MSWLDGMLCDYEVSNSLGVGCPYTLREIIARRKELKLSLEVV